MTTALRTAPAESPQPAVASSPARAASRRRRLWVALFLPVFVINAGWALLSPAFSTPDEWAHVMKAAAVVRGQLLGRTVKVGESSVTEVHVPQVFQAGAFLGDCYAGHLDRTPKCAPPMRGSKQVVPSDTSAGRYPPLFYALIGLPARYFPSVAGDYFMRLISALIASLLIVGALLTALDIRSSPLVPIGVVAAVTPMVLFLNGSPNPNGLENAAAIAVWVGLIALLLEPEDASFGRVLTRTGVAAILLVHMRGLSPVWMAVIVGALLLSTTRRRIAELVRQRRVQIWAAVVVANAALASAWILLAGTLGLGWRSPVDPHQSVIRTTIGKATSNIHQMIGFFGGLEHPAPALTYLVWFFVLGFLVLGAVVVGRVRAALVLAGIIAITVVAPILIEAKQARTMGFVWQGRYMLPVAVGIPILASYILGREWQLPETTARRARAILVLTLAVGSAVAYTGTARRYTVGWNGPVLFLFRTQWEPPVPVAVLVPMFWVASLLIAALVTASTTRTAPPLTEVSVDNRRKWRYSTDTSQD